MSVIKLGEQQQEILDSLKEFIHNGKLCISLVGFPGTGKSTLVKFLLEYLNEIHFNYSLVSTTNKAALVLQKITNDNVLTLHKLLSLSPNLEILNLDLLTLMFHSKGMNDIPKNGVIICDEASMISDDLFDLLVEECRDKKCKIIFVGDSKQLKPVKHTGLSKVFRVNSLILSKVYRQDPENKIMPILDILRESPIDIFEANEGDKGSLVVTSDYSKFIHSSIPKFREAIDNRDILNCKMICYTNQQVSINNNNIRKLLFNSKEEYFKNEIIIASENIKMCNGDIINSMDYIINNTPTLSKKEIPFFCKMDGYLLDLYDSYEKKYYNTFILSRNTSENHKHSLAALIDKLRVTAVKSVKGTKQYSMNWGNYYNLYNSFSIPFDLFYENRLIKKKTFDYGYCITSHKSQGSSYNNIFVDIKDINKCIDDVERRQMQYVAISRTFNDVYIYQ